MSALATPPLRRLPLAGGLVACAALGAALLVGPGGTPVPSAALGLLAALLLVGEVGRRTLALLRAGFGSYLLIGALATGIVGAAWAVVVAFHMEYAAVTLLLGTLGLALVTVPVLDARARMGRGATPWQALTGGPTPALAAQAMFKRLGPLLLGVLFLLLALRLGAFVLVDMARAAADGAISFAVVFLLGAAVAALLGAALVRARPHGVGAPTTTRDEQVVAAHLHDSVLQTLALIQRSKNDPARVAQLARQQERSLRAWLAGRDEHAASTLAGALRAAAREVEDEEPGAIIEVVAVGDASLDRPADAMVRAAREAMRNAVRHAGSPVRVFLEVEDDVREVFVRDTGPGFDLGSVDEGRRGVRDAIIGRMDHVGGTAEIDTGAGGTEVALAWRAPRSER